MNFITSNTFEGGNSKDMSDNFEKKNTFEKGVNGRLYSHNGVVSFTSIEGSKLVYENTSVLKWLGSYPFREELIVFAKILKPTGSGQETEETICEQILSSNSFALDFDVTTGTIITTAFQISENSEQIESCYDVVKPLVDPTDFQTPYSEVISETENINFGEYYEERVNIADFTICSINLNEIPINNNLYYDAIFSFSLNEEGILKGTRIWFGAQNWPINGKISCEGVEENEFYKRVYYTDAVNPRRVVNIKDTSLSTRKASEFNQILDNVLLQPEVKEILEGGQLNAMRALYMYRIISENGQVSEFSPFSDFAYVLVEDSAIKFRGGETSESTGKSVTVKCNILNPEPSAEVECIALEFEAFGPPTAIKNLGIKRAAAVVEFKHLGNESEFIDDITINDVLEFKNTWKYCNDFTSKKNKLIAAGLRNNPIPTEIQNLEYLFPLHAWDANGNSFDSLMNPEPWTFRYIDPTLTGSLVYIKQKKYEQLASFGPMKLTFINKIDGLNLTKTFFNLSLEKYTDVISEVIEWLLYEQENNEFFNIIFPNLKIVDNNSQLLFSPIDENVKTDFKDYIFESNNDQFIENFKNQLIFLNPPVDVSKLVHGGQSIGFNDGNGIRVTYRNVKTALLNQAQSVYDGTGKVLDFETPTLEKFFMKGEIYRLAFQAYDKASSRYFSIPIGDVMIPELGDIRQEIDNQGNIVLISEKYVNQSVENGVLYGHGIKMHIEVRLSCEMQDLISMYQILYVERSEDNRTILCQGIAAPMYRLQYDGNEDHKMPEPLLSKWVLPYYGGPVYEKNGLRSYDELGENFDYQGDGRNGEDYKKIMTSRKLMAFDSPDLYFNHISSKHLKNSKLQVLSKLNTDHTPNTIMQRGGYLGKPNEIYPKFSRKITEDYLEGPLNLENLPRKAREDRESGTFESYFINVSVFAKSLSIAKQEFTIKHAEDFNRGEIISGAPFELSNDISNNAMAMPCMPWFFSAYQRRSDRQDGRSRADLFREAVVSPGYSTVVIKTEDDLFTPEFIGKDIFKVSPEIRLGGGPYTVYETYPLINIFRNNRESVYGGRTEQAYSQNTFIPLSKTIPVSKNTGVQSFDVSGDTFVTLNIRTKNDAGDDSTYPEIEFDNGGGGRAKGEIKTFKRPAAWNYVVVLETQIEPKMAFESQFYREIGSHRFDLIKAEEINSAYFNGYSLKQFIAKPFKFKDDPNMGNVVAVSNVKLAGEIYDAWTMFKPNNFYAELEKNKGDVSNIIRFKEQVYAVQEDQTSLLYIGTDRILNDQDGTPINIKQGSGTVVDGHNVVSNYGTSIRRSVSESEYGFSFFDEKHMEFIKIDKPLLFVHLLHLDFWNEMKGDSIIDSESYFDHKNKETNIRVRTKKGKSFLFSYNELFQAFNGNYEYNNDLYLLFDKKVYAPVLGDPSKIHELNEGDPLNLFGDQKTMKLKCIVHAEIGQVLQYAQTNVISDLEYPLSNIVYKTSLNQSRIVTGRHPYYKLREGTHSIPAKNESNLSDEVADLRGKWISVEITAESKNKNKVNILAVQNALRKSHQ